MFTKHPYEAPQAEQFQLAMGRPILEGSPTGSGTGTGASVTFESESSFDDFFNE